MSIQIFTHTNTFKFESGAELQSLEIAYQTFGSINEKQDNVVWVCHALTGNSDVFDWWQGLFGEDDLFNPKDHFIVCANILGSSYGTTCPLSFNPETQQGYYRSFPQFTVKDMVEVQKLLADHLGISEIGLLIGGSLGGQQAVEWAISEPLRIKRLIIIATNAVHSPWGVAFNESQRLAIAADPTYFDDTPDGGKDGLKAARSIALLSYRNYETYANSQMEDGNEKWDNFKASSYQNYQGDKLVKRFNAYSYWYLSKAMDSHNVGRHRSSIVEALREIQAQTLVVGISSDILFPPSEQRFLAEKIPGASYLEIDSYYGHDGFLIETGILTYEIMKFLKNTAAEGALIHLHRTV
ncbi:homoserine O-acetyltransferase [Paradesertivirga mongoliensis]|uniref:Homoserine O-acetyltransferase n=1 Tax=Paradesertivirga mongoliensis TaxID=2100740 RepID=A0ABW4ZQ74_9SPHI|nr:homoserine O-acetyltransferase [Pedobacter mongoliensis]